MNYDDQVKELGQKNVQAIEDAVSAVSEQLGDATGTLALCELLVDMIAVTIRESADRYEVDELGITGTLARQLHDLVPSMQDMAAGKPYEAMRPDKSQGRERWRFPPLVPERLGDPLGDKHAFWLQGLVEELDALLVGRPCTVLAELAGRLLAHHVRVGIIKEIPIDVLFEDALARALDTLWAWDAMADLPPKKEVAR